MNDKYRKFTSAELSQDNMEEELDGLISQKEKERSTLNTSLANLLAEIQATNKAKDDLAGDKQAKLREIECEFLHASIVSGTVAREILNCPYSHQQENQC